MTKFLRKILKSNNIIFTVLFLIYCFQAYGVENSNILARKVNYSFVAKGFSKTKVNATIYRTNALISHGDTQYIAYYDPDANVILGKRKHGTNQWELHKTQYKGNVNDTHNVICIAIDGKGYLHMSWDHHCHKLNYCRSVKPGSLELTDKMPMTGRKDGVVTYPEFFNLPNGDLLFLYRDGGSGAGNTMLSRYDVKSEKWSVVQDAFINGEKERCSYTNQIAIDRKGVWHISWCWRETPAAHTNHDICYAKSDDEGKTWYKSTGEKYELPITQKNAEVVVAIPQNSELINQTSNTVDSKGNPFICQYWKPEGDVTPQFHLIFHNGKEWQVRQITKRKTPFTLADIGKKPIQISRPKVLIGRNDRVYVIFRDVERGDGVSIAVADAPNYDKWTIEDISNTKLGPWEPAYDPYLWHRFGILHIFHQSVEWMDAKKEPTDISVLECTLK